MLCDITCTTGIWCFPDTWCNTLLFKIQYASLPRPTQNSMWEIHVLLHLLIPWGNHFTPALSRGTVPFRSMMLTQACPLFWRLILPWAWLCSLLLLFHHILSIKANNILIHLLCFAVSLSQQKLLLKILSKFLLSCQRIWP